MADDRRRNGKKPNDAPSSLEYKKYKPWEGQARFMGAGPIKSRAFDKMVERDKEAIKRHNRLVDLRKEEEKARRKLNRHREEDDLPAPAPVAFGKESLQDDDYAALRTEALASRKQYRQEKYEKKQKTTEQLARSSKKRARSEILETDEKTGNIEKTASDEPPKKVKATQEAVKSDSTAPVTQEADSSEKKAQTTTKAGKPAHSFAEARARWEEKQQQKKERQEAYEKRQQDIAKKQEAMKQTSKKLMRRTSRGQPIMKNVVNHMLAKLEKP